MGSYPFGQTSAVSSLVTGDLTLTSTATAGQYYATVVTINNVTSVSSPSTIEIPAFTINLGTPTSSNNNTFKGYTDVSNVPSFTSFDLSSTVETTSPTNFGLTLEKTVGEVFTPSSGTLINTTNPTFTFAAVPEPSSWMLGLLAALGFAAVLKRKSRTA